ncbi:HRDC domain-containing protein [Corynebacterium sp. Q4381]|uniref:HRDC domain-containing protein n=1 Tax=Corynebacterium sp. Marseille-Q4381 TaxID=3121597 RepID=UPI002FE57939
MEKRPAYELVDTPEGYRRAAAALAQGRGPFAVDTERASAYRYDDRAFLVQIHRRGAGTFLIAPEGHRREVEAILGPVVNDGDWIIHAAGEDLASLALLGLHPGSLFDTELAARFAGFDRPNLAAVVEHYTGVLLEKGHGKEDWSLTPLPEDWLDYAALDVAYLHDLAESLAEELDHAGVLSFAAAEFDHLVETRSLKPAPRRTWRDLKGVASVRSPRGLQIARTLYNARAHEARRSDVAPNSVLPSRVVVAIARAEPATPGQLARIPGFPARRRGAAQHWMSYVEQALADDPTSFPAPAVRDRSKPPTKANWERSHPENFAALEEAKQLLGDASRDLGFPPEILLTPAILREVVWRAHATDDTHSVVASLMSSGARQWQAEIAAPLIAKAVQAHPH